MGRINTRNKKVILLFDNYNEYSNDLYESYKLSGYNYPAICINTDGFLPDDVISIYEYFLGDYKNNIDTESSPIDSNILGIPRYFNQIKLPDYWKIEADNTIAKVYYHDKIKAKIYYTGKGIKRVVKLVEWLSEDSTKVKCIDYYNKYGCLYARSIGNKEGKLVNKTYISIDGKETIEENYITGNIILSYGSITKIFRSKSEFVVYGLFKLGYLDYTYYYNSLSTPFLVSQLVSNKNTKDKLFWQEDIKDTIPGNMEFILDGKSNTDTIYIQNKTVYNKLLSLGVDKDKIKEKGYVYNFIRDNNYRDNALICTDSDDIPNIETIISELPNINFHIAAVTKMSDKLLALDRYNNVTLYPGILIDKYNELMDTCDIYLDINRGGTITNSIKTAFLNNQVIFAYKETSHNINYAASVYSIDDVSSMIKDLRSILDSTTSVDTYLVAQHISALSEEKQSY